MKARRKKTCSKNCIYIHDGKKKKSPKVEMIRRYQYLIGLHFCSLLLLVGNPLLAFHFWSKRDANRTVDTGSVNIWYESFFFFLKKKGSARCFLAAGIRKTEKARVFTSAPFISESWVACRHCFFCLCSRGGYDICFAIVFFCFYDNAHPIRIGTRSPCGKRNQGRRTVIVVNVIFAKNWLQYVCTCCT